MAPPTGELADEANKVELISLTSTKAWYWSAVMSMPETVPSISLTTWSTTA